MGKRQTAVNRRKGVTIALLSLACCFVFIFCFSGMSADMPVKAADNEIDISSGNTVTNYYMDISMNGMEARLSDKQFMRKWGDFKAWSRQDKNVTVIFRLDNVKYKEGDKPESTVMATKIVSINFPGSQTTSQTIKFNETVSINIRETYYNYFKYKQEGGADLTKFHISIFWDGVGVPLYRVGAGLITSDDYIFTAAVALRVGANTPTDPTDPDFELGDNGADDATPDKDNQSFFEKFFNWLKGIFNWNISYKTFQRICIITVAVIIALIILSFIFKRKK